MCLFVCNIRTKSNVPTWLLRAEYSVHLVCVLKKIQLRTAQVKHAQQEIMCMRYMPNVAYEITNNTSLCTA